MLKNVVADRAIDQPPASSGPPRPHAIFGPVSDENRRGSQYSGSHPGSYGDSIERQLSRLQRRSRDVLGHKLIRNPAAPALRRIGQALLTNLQRLQGMNCGMNAAGERRDSAVPPIERIIQSSHRLLDIIVAQIALCDSTARATLAVAEWGRRIKCQEPFKYYKLLPLFDRVCDEIRQSRELQLLIPTPGLPLAALVESQTGMIDAANFVGGVTTARVLVWLLGGDQRYTQRLPRLVLAALLQDVGRLPVNSGGLLVRAQQEDNTDWLEQQHPTMGAALFGSVRGTPVELPMLVAQHHEQLDGGGFPRALMACDVLPDSAILAAAGRFAEFCLVPAGATLPGEASPADASSLRAGKNAPARAADALLSEAEWGKWPLDFSRRLAQSVAEAESLEHGQLTERIDAAGPAEIGSSEPSAFDATTGDRLLQLHDQEKNLQGTHIDAAPRYTGITVRDGKSQFGSG